MVEVTIDPEEYGAILIACLEPDDSKANARLRWPSAWVLRKTIKRFPELEHVECGKLINEFTRKNVGYSPYDLATEGEWYDASDDFAHACIEKGWISLTFDKRVMDWGDVDEWGLSQTF